MLTLLVPTVSHQDTAVPRFNIFTHTLWLALPLLSLFLSPYICSFDFLSLQMFYIVDQNHY